MPCEKERPIPVPADPERPLGGEERLEDPAGRSLGNAGAGVADVDQDAPGLVHRGADGEHLLERLALLDRLLGVDDQIDEELVELVAIALDQRQAGAVIDLDRDPGGAERIIGNLERRRRSAREVDQAARPLALPRHAKGRSGRSASSGRPPR